MNCLTTKIFFKRKQKKKKAHDKSQIYLEELWKLLLLYFETDNRQPDKQRKLILPVLKAAIIEFKGRKKQKKLKQKL